MRKKSLWSKAMAIMLSAVTVAGSIPTTALAADTFMAAESGNAQNNSDADDGSIQAAASEDTAGTGMAAETDSEIAAESESAAEIYAETETVVSTGTESETQTSKNGADDETLSSSDLVSGTLTDADCTDQMTDGAAEESTGESAGESIGELTGESTEESAGESSGESTGESTGDSTEESVAESASEAGEEAAEETAAEMTEAPVEEVTAEASGSAVLYAYVNDLTVKVANADGSEFPAGVSLSLIPVSELEEAETLQADIRAALLEMYAEKYLAENAGVDAAVDEIAADMSDYIQGITCFEASVCSAQGEEYAAEDLSVMIQSVGAYQQIMTGEYLADIVQFDSEGNASFVECTKETVSAEWRNDYSFHCDSVNGIYAVSYVAADYVYNAPEKEEHFLEEAKGVEELDAAQFATARLIVLADDPEVIVDPENLIGQYEDIYLLQYKTVGQSMNAYLYYAEAASETAPDVVIYSAGEEAAAEEEAVFDAGNDTAGAEQSGVITNSGENPVEAIAANPVSAAGMIALIDTGASGANVVGQVSMIDDVLTGNGHGDQMAEYIAGQNPQAQIFSIRAMDDNGHGTTAAVVSAIEYAIENQASVINLSLSGVKSLSAGVLEAEILKAVAAGIPVVAAAGNNGQDASGYVPGCFHSVYTIGAAEEDGTRVASSNYGDAVDYYVTAGTTSEAAAKFTGYITRYGINAADSDTTGLIFKEASEADEAAEFGLSDHVIAESDDTIYDPVIENYVRENANPAYVGSGTLKLVNIMDLYVTMSGSQAATIDAFNTSEAVENLDFYQQTGRVPVYVFDPDSGYAVAFIDTMSNDGNAAVMDVGVAKNDTSGFMADGCLYDSSAGLIYIPVSNFYGDDGTYYYNGLRAQILYSLRDFGNENVSGVLYSADNGDETYSSGSFEGAIAADNSSVEIGSGFDVNTMFISVNGFPISGNYAYDSESGILTLPYSAAVMESVRIKAVKDEDDPKVDPGVDTAGTKGYSSAVLTSFDSMAFCSAKIANVEYDTLKDYWKKGTLLSSRVTLLYGSAASFFSDAYAANYDITQSDGWSSLISYLSVDGGTNPFVQSGSAAQVYLGGNFYRVELDSIDIDGVDFGDFTDIALWAKCIHIGSSADPGFVAGTREQRTYSANVKFKVVYMQTSGDEPYAVFAGVSSTSAGTQNMECLFKVHIQENFGIKITKLCHNNTTDERNWLTLTGMSSYYSMKGTVYTIYSKKSCSSGSKIGEITLNKNGTSSVFEIDVTKYDVVYVKETKAPSGYFRILNEWKDTGKSYLEQFNDDDGYTVLKVDIAKAKKAGKSLITLRSREYPHRYPLYIIKYYLAADGTKVMVQDDSYDGHVFYLQYKDPETGEWVTDENDPSMRAVVVNGVAVFGEDGDGNFRCGIYDSDDDGIADKLDRGGLFFGVKYRIRESEYLAVDTKYKTTLADDIANGVKISDWTDGYLTVSKSSFPSARVEKKFVNNSTSYYGYIQGRKVISSDYSEISGYSVYTTASPTFVSFDIYEDEACTNLLATLYTTGTVSDDGYDYTSVYELNLGEETSKDVWIKETIRNDVTKAGGTSEPVKVTVTDGNTAEAPSLFTFENFLQSGGGAVYKYDTDTGAPLGGATFLIEYFDTAKTDLTGLTPAAHWYLTSDTAGYAYFDDAHIADAAKWSSDALPKKPDGTVIMPLGVYRITEVEAPPGYKAVSEEPAIRASVPSALWTAAEPISFENDTEPVKVRKVSANSELTAKYKDLYGSFEGVTFTFAGEGGTYTFTCDAEGNSEVQNVVAGDYTVTESNVPDGYLAINPNPMTVTVAETHSAEPQVITFEDIPEAVVNIRKTSADPAITKENGMYSFSGAAFTLTDAAGNVAATLICDANGESSPVQIAAGTYTVTETVTPAGYKTTAPFTYTISADATGLQTISVSDEPIVGSADAVIQKLRRDNGQNGPSLKGAQIQVAYFDNTDCSGTPKRTWVFQSDENGEIHLADAAYKYSGDELYTRDGAAVFPLGSLRIAEIGAPWGYEIDPTVSQVRITQGSDESAVFSMELNALKIYEPERYYGVTVPKIDAEKNTNTAQGDATLAGAEFTIYNANDYTVHTAENRTASFAKGEAVATFTTGEDGVAVYGKFTADADGVTEALEGLQAGTYLIRETKASEGYRLNSDWSYTFTAGGSTDSPDPAGTRYTAPESCAEQVKRSGISLQKLDAELDANIAQGEGTLKGARFAILDLIALSAQDGTTAQTIGTQPTYAALRDLYDNHEECVVGTITTDENGNCATSADALVYGTYYVIEVEASYGYCIADDFVGKAVLRDDNVVVALGEPVGSSTFENIHNKGEAAVKEQPRRADLEFLKVNIDGEYKAYTPFLISAVEIDEDGKETIVEEHVIVTDANGKASTKNSERVHSFKTNGFDSEVYVDLKNGKLTDAGNAILKALAEAEKNGTSVSAEDDPSTWGIWFQDGGEDRTDAGCGALYTCYYRITELQCESNAALCENLLQSELIYVENDTCEYTELTANNAELITYHPLVDTEIVLTSHAKDTESGTQTVPARDSVEVSDTVDFTHVSADHQYRLDVQFLDVTDGNKVLHILGTNDADAEVSEDGKTVSRVFRPDKKSGTNNTYGEIGLTALLDSGDLSGHTLMAVDYLYEYIDVSDHDGVDGVWIKVAIHPFNASNAIVIDEDQLLYVPDLSTQARDSVTGDRAGALSESDSILDTVAYSNLSPKESYAIVMRVVDRDSGEDMVKGQSVQSRIIYKRGDAPISGTVEMPEYKLDTSNFDGGEAAVVIESLYRVDEDGNLLGEPILVHDSLLDENETIRWPQVKTTATDKNTADDVGTDEGKATVYDAVHITNVIFDADDHENGSSYSYTLKGTLVYQKDFTDADGVSHKAGEEVKTLEGTKDTVTVTSDASGSAAFTYADGTEAEGTLTITGRGYGVSKKLGGSAADNTYVEDNSAAVASIDVTLQFAVDSTKLEGGTVVVFEKLYHDASGSGRAAVASHENLTDKGQTIHYPKVRTSAVDDATKDGVGALRKDASITDTVKLENLVAGRTYTVKGVLKDPLTGADFLINGKKFTREAAITVTSDGKITAAGGEKTTVTKYDKDKNEVSGTVDLVFRFDATGLEDRTCVVFEDLYHNNVKVAAHNDLTDKEQTVHFPKIRTTASDGETKDHTGTVTETVTINDAVEYSNLVIGKEYTVEGTLMLRKTGGALLDADGNKITASITFTAGETKKGIAITEKDEEHNRVSGTATLNFTLDSTLLAGKTVVAFEKLFHNKAEVTAHEDLTDEEQTIHYPKIRTSAIDKNVCDEVGKAAETTITDTVSFANLVPGCTYQVSGVLMDKETGKELLVNGKKVTREAALTVAADGTVTAAGGEKVTYTYDKDNKSSSGTVAMDYTFDASGLEGKSVVVFEYLYHNNVLVTAHAELSDLAQTVHFPKIRTTAKDLATQDNAGTVTGKAAVVDAVQYTNLVIGREYTIKGTLMNQETGLAVTNEDGTIVTAEATFTASRESSGDNSVTEVHEDNDTVNGAYTLTFTLDSGVLAGQTVVVFEDLYHNEVKVTTHSDLHDKDQSVHYPQVHTKAIDQGTGDHVGSIFGAFINGVRKLLGNEAEATQTIVDTVSLENLVPGCTYVVSGKLYNASISRKNGEAVALTVDGKEVTQAVTITVAADGKSITAQGGEKTSVAAYDAQTQTVDGSVDLSYTLDSSLVQDIQVVVFETLYHDSAYTEGTVPTSVKEEDKVHEHSDYEDEEQSVSEVSIHTTAVDSRTATHTGVVPGEAASVIMDEVNLSGLLPGMEYTIRGVLVDLDSVNGTAKYLKADGTFTEDRSEAYTEMLTFTSEKEEETKTLNFTISSDKVQGKSLTVFEDLLHNGTVISSHPGNSADGGVDKDALKAQTVYYPAGKTNAADNTTGTHSGLAGTRTITDRVYFENLQAGQAYSIEGTLMYQETFTDKSGAAHQAGEAIEGTTRKVTFTADASLTEAAYADGDGTAAVDTVTVKDNEDGTRSVSGYVSLMFTVDASALAGISLVAAETFYEGETPIFVHKDLSDLPQTIRIPDVQTRASSLDLDEAAIYNEDGTYRDITITDTVTFKNLWTQAELDQMAEDGKHLVFRDGTYRTADTDIYAVNETAKYVLKGVLMDKETGEALKDENGNEYAAYSEVFTPEAKDGSQDVTFTINAGAFMKDGGNTLEGKTVVVFEDLYQVTGTESTDAEKTTDEKHIAEHHDIADDEQDIRFPKGRTHAADGTTGTEAANHVSEETAATHEVYAADSITITDMVSFENLHGAAKYTVTGKLMVITQNDENGQPTAYEAAKDDNGNEITAAAELDTTSLSEDYNASVSGSIALTFTFSGVSLAGKETVAFETISREGKAVAVHADITDEAQKICFPEIHTEAYDASGKLHETTASENTVIIDKVSYTNLEAGTTYKLSAVLHRQDNGRKVSGSAMEGTFVAGAADQYITADGTKVLTQAELESYLNGDGLTGTEASASDDGLCSGAVYVVIPVNTSKLGGKTVVVFETLYAFGQKDGAGECKVIADHSDLTDSGQSVRILKPDTKDGGESSGGGQSAGGGQQAAAGYSAAAGSVKTADDAPVGLMTAAMAAAAAVMLAVLRRRKKRSRS